MTVTIFKIILDNPSASYFAGQVITGRIVLDLDAERKTSGLKLKCIGKSHVRWTERVQESTGTGSTRRTTSRTVTYSDSDTYFDNKVYLLGSSDSPNFMIQPGRRELPFSFQLPLGIPSSFKGQYGYVQYSLEATLKKSFGFDKNTSLIFTVNGILDLNTYNGAGSPAVLSKSKHLGCLCCKSGPISFNFKLNRQGFVPGEPLHFMLEMLNMSSDPVSGVKLKLYRDIGFHARGKTKHQSSKVLEFHGPGVEGGDTEIWTGANNMLIPCLPPTNLAGCRIITVRYKLEVEMVIPSGFNLSGSTPIIIGTIPFRTDFSSIHAGFGGWNDGPRQLPSSSPIPNAPSLMLIDGYPDLPPPTYEEAFSGGEMVGLPSYSEATTGDNPETNGNANNKPSAPFDPEFVPKYATYGWNSPS